MVRKVLINYANDAFRESQKKNTKTGIEVAGFDSVIEYSPKDIDKKFYRKNKYILRQLRGGGYWLWKPYIIFKTLMKREIKNGDYIFYADSGSYFIDKIDFILDISKKYNQDIIPFTSNDADIEKNWTKKDVFILMGLDSRKYTETPQRGPGFILLKKSKKSKKFFKEFLKYAQDERIITDMPSELGEDPQGFVENRHDQSIFSLLSKKYNLKAFRHPFEIQNKKRDCPLGDYPQIAVLTRKNNRSIVEKIKYQKSCSKNNIDFMGRLVKIFYNQIIK
jgi:hypothetical protein